MDNLTKEQRRKNMQNIRSKNTSIEVILRKALWEKGYRYRKNYEKLPGNPAVGVKLVRRDDVLVGGDLENGICRCVNDQISGFHVVVAVLFNNGGSGPWGVGQHASAGCLPEGS